MRWIFVALTACHKDPAHFRPVISALANRKRAPLQMEVLLPIVPLLALLAFIAWDRHRLSSTRPPALPRSALENGWMPRTDGKFLAITGVSIGMGVMAISEWVNPSFPPFSGKFSWLYTIAHLAFGAYGKAILFAAFAILFAFSALAVRRCASAENAQ